jgi:signal transduction histidine kinase/ActR/RegA family two-component response regulator
VTSPPPSRLLLFARELQRASTFGELMDATLVEVEEILGFHHTWLMVAENEELTHFRLIDAAGRRRGLFWEVAPVLDTRGDSMMAEILRGDRPVVVVDARTDPRTNKEIVAQLGNRSIVNVPLRLVDKPFGVLGMGTFGDEELRDPSPEELDYLVGMATQISVAVGRIRFQEERRQSAEALARVEEQLRQAQKMEAVGRLAGGVAHDFNNLLSVVLTCSQFLLDALDEDDPRHSDAKSIQLAGQRARDLTRQLLAFGRQQVLEPKVLDLREVVADMEDMLRRIIGEDIVLEIRHAAEMGRTRADQSQVEQIVMNLVVNARDAMPSGGRLTIETSQVDLDEAYAREHVGTRHGPHVMLAVSDNGTGMDKATRERVFEPFFTTKEKGKGTGLGLSTVFGIVQQSGGSIWVYSEPGAGATFKVYLPITDDAVSAPVALPAAVSLAGTETILVVEDEEQVRAIVGSILKRHGYRVLEARGHEEAVAWAEKPGPLHLLLTDVVMPGMGGRELARRLSVLRPDLRVLFMSGYTDNAIVHHGVLDPGVMLLEKPITPDALARKVRYALDAARRPAG